MLDNLIVSPRLNFRYSPNEHFVLRAGYSSGFRAPQVYDEDLHVGAVNGELFKLVNADGLRHERSHSLNTSADFCFHFGHVEGDLLIEGFYTRIDDAFVNELVFSDTTSGYLLYERHNSDGAEVKGLNVELRITPAEKLQFQFGGTMQSSRYTGSGHEWSEGRFEHRMERVPGVYGYFNGVYRPLEPLQLMVSGIFTGSMLVYHSVVSGSKHSSSLDVMQVTTPSFFDLTFKASYSIRLGRKSSVEVNVGVQNLFDSFQRDFDSGPDRDASYIYGPSRPRTIFAGAKLKI